MNGKPRLSTILLLIGMVATLVLSFNLWSSNKELKDKNRQLANTLEQMEAVASEEKELFTKTESFLKDSMQGKAMDYFSEGYKTEVEDIIDSDENHQDGAISEMEEIEVYNISVREQKEQFRVYAIYKVTLTGIDDEFEKPGDQPVLFLMSTIDWVKEDDTYKVDHHTLEPLTSAEQAVTNITS